MPPTRNLQRSATSADVAQLAGLSRSTVSQILNGNVAQFPQATQDRVAAAAAELRYRPSRAGRALATGVSDMVVIAFPRTTLSTHFQDAVDQITDAVAGRGMTVIVHFARSDSADSVTSIHDLRPAVIIDFGVFTDQEARVLQESGSRFLPPPARDDESDELNRHVGRLQVRELLRRGKYSIIFAQLADTRSTPYGDERLRGAQEECAAQGIPHPRVIRVPLDKSGAVAVMTEAIADGGDEPIGVCAYNDDVAIAVMTAASELGRSVPEHLAVVGVDNTPIGQLMSPRLTTIDIDLPKVMMLFLEAVAPPETSGARKPQTWPGLDPTDFVRLIDGESC